MSRLRSVLDGVTTAAILTTCGVLLYTNWPKSGPGPVVPKGPITLDGATVKGDLAAPVVLIEWSDYQCPYCARAETDVIAALDEKYVKSNRVLFAFRHNPLTKIHPQAARAAEAALCAGKQQRFWEMHASLFQDAKQMAEADIMKRAAALKLDQRQFADCLASGAAAPQIAADMKGAAAMSLTGTPAFLVGRRQPDGRVKPTAVLSGVRPLAAFESAIEAAEKGERLSGAAIWFMSGGATLLLLLSAFVLRRRKLARNSRSLADADQTTISRHDSNLVRDGGAE